MLLDTEITAKLNSDFCMQLVKIKEFASKHLSAIKRRSGESYFQHGVELVEILQEVTRDKSLLAAALIHDILRHPQGGHLLEKSPLDFQTKKLAKEMYGLRRLHIYYRTEDLDVLISAFTKDWRLLFFRMAHRLNDIRHLDRFDPNLRRMIAKETFHMYTSFAGRLGLNVWRHEMETACFKVLYQQIASQLEEKFTAYRELDLACLNVTKKFLIRVLKKNHVKASVEYRIKSLYSTYRKMMFKKRKFEELTDRLAIRILVDKIEDCYKILGIVHNAMHPIPGKLKDYIGAPKENGYQSIHTVVYPMPGISEQPIEIQIRTREIHQTSEYGISSHHQYKDLVYSLHRGTTQVNLFRNLEILRREVSSPQQFEAALKTYFNENRLLIFDEKNNLYHIKRPASALDFAFQVYLEKFPRIRSIIVNGRIDSFDRLLKDGDVLRVNFSTIPTINKDWINACLQKQTRSFIKKTSDKIKQ